MGMSLWPDQTFFQGILDFETEGSWLEYEERGCRPKSTRTEVNIAAVADLVKK
jgi:hypothetical protein